jgi:DNA mismatch endonuclease (patch repair protein)
VNRDPAVTSRIMSAIHTRDTMPEMLLRRELHRRGLRYRVRTGIFGHPDIVFPTPKLVVFVDGDYWHGNTWRIRGAKSLEEYLSGHANSDFWLKKIRTNIARDKSVTEQLTAAGWTVIRLWESQIVADLTSQADQIERHARDRYAGLASASTWGVA